MRILRHPAARGFIYLGVLAYAAYKLTPAIEARDTHNGFDVVDALIPPAQILSGGPPRDGIPALSNPRVLPVAKASYLQPSDRILGVTRNGESRAYPIRLLNWHEVVNDTVGGEPTVISYCPLCGTGMVFDARVDGRILEFGVSGLLYNSDMLLYDRDSESLWSQVMGQAVTARMRGAKLVRVPASYTSWSAWKAAHPDGSVLDIHTGYGRDYSRDPYAGYESSRTLYFKVTHRDGRYHEKEPIVGLVLEGKAKVWPLSELAKVDQFPLTDSLNGIALNIEYSQLEQSVTITNATGQALPSVPGYWFAWLAFYPDSSVFAAGKK